ncbi:M81 family metallopeptidase [Ornithinibacillus sp. 4-3]|uniref:M81 family metallopeptidase n=1 Tax=Ornithinibacillus sp. 4-3 TaxID=3231488 RepID=A0AB39HUH9_9BACI
MRIAILELKQESNSFCYVNCQLSDFKRVYYYCGEEIIKHRGSAGTEINGFLDILNKEDVEVVPIIATHAYSSGPVTQDAIDNFAEEISKRLKQAGPLDGVLAAMHGAMVSEEDEDPEGSILKMIRKIVGDIPVIATMDLHANITQQKIKSATGIIGYRHYPHIDTRETGQRAASLLLKTVREEANPIMAMAKVPMIVPCNTDSKTGPLRKIVDEEHCLEKEEDILSVSAFPVQPWLDISGIGFSTIVITNNNTKKAKSEAIKLAKMGWDLRHEFYVKPYEVDEAIRLGLESVEKTVLLVDTADAIGAGSTGDSTAVLERMLACDVQEKCILGIVDPQVALDAATMGVKEKVRVKVGNQIDPRRGKPVEIEGIVKHISDGEFLYKGLYGGSYGNMGLSVVLEIGNISLLVSTYPTYEWDDAQYRSMGLNVEEAKLVVIKQPVNFRTTYKHLTDKVFILDTPGPASPNFKNYSYTKVTRPLHPLDEMESMDLQIIVRDSRHLTI